jgi:hypothetical protein
MTRRPKYEARKLHSFPLWARRWEEQSPVDTAVGMAPLWRGTVGLPCAPPSSSSIFSPPRAAALNEAVAAPSVPPHAATSKLQAERFFTKRLPSHFHPHLLARPHLRTTRSLGWSSGRMRLDGASSWKTAGGGEKARHDSGGWQLRHR